PHTTTGSLCSSCLSSTSFVSVNSCAAARALHSFPTRRSSDLEAQMGGVGDLLRSACRGSVGQGQAELLVFVGGGDEVVGVEAHTDRKSTRLNSSHVSISYAVFCLKKKINS